MEGFNFICSLFDSCNLDCEFCLSKKNTAIDVDYIEKLPYIVENKLFEDAKNFDVIHIRLRGGEVFSDNIPNKVYDSYYKLVDSFNELGVKHSKKILFHWLSNGVFTNYDRVDKLLDYTKADIDLSYDCEGRFSDKDKQQFKRTVDYYLNKNLLHQFSLTLTLTNIKLLPKDTWFLDLCKNNNIYIDVTYYYPNYMYEKYMPTDDDIFEFYKWGLDNKYVNINVIDDIIKSLNGYKVKHCDCDCGSYHTSKIYSKNCVRCNTCFDQSLYYKKPITEENVYSIKRQLFIEKRGCLTCPHYSYCTGMCNGCFLFKDYKMGECPLKRIYEGVCK